MTLKFVGFILLLILTSCGPKPVARVYPTPKTDFGPLQTDPSIPLDKLRAASVDAGLLKWNETIDSARLFRFGQTAIELGALKNSLELKKLGVRVGTAFYSAHNSATHSSFEDALYIKAAVGETKEDVMPVLDKYDKMLVDQLPIVRGILTKTAAHFPWPQPTTQPKAALLLAKAYAKQVMDRVNESSVDPDLAKGIASAFDTDFYPILDGLSGQINSIMNESSSIVMIDRLRALAKKYEVDFGDSTNKVIDQARDVFVQIGEIDRNQDALTVIVELWQMTAPESREKTFKPVSEELYNFLKDKGPHSLACVKSSSCLNPIILFEKKLGLLPAIQKYGLDKLKTDIEKAAHDALLDQIQTAIAGFVPTIPQELDQKITAEVDTLRKKLASVKADYSGFIHGIANEYQKQDLGSSDGIRIAGLEANRVTISMSPGKVAISGPETSETATGSEVIGDSMSYAAAVWNSTTPGSLAYSKSIISQIDKMLALGGFETPSKKSYDSLAISLDGTSKHFDVRNDLSAKTPFAVPDSFLVTKDLLPKFEAKVGRNVSVRGQAELLRGLAAQARYFQDWKKNGYDSTIGAVEVGKLIKDLPAGSIDSKLFPKDSFFALSVANAATILLNMTKSLSPVFLIDITRKAQWANDRSDDSDQPATMAGIVDIVDGVRSTKVDAADAARFLLAIADFLDATKGMEQTQAHPLITPGADGTKPIDQLATARTQLTMLVVGIGNFLSHEMQAQDGGIRSTFKQDLVSVTANQPRRAIDQAICILALLKAGEVLNKQVFDWSALDAYAFMNKTLYNSAKGFYLAAEGAAEIPPPDQIATILLAGEKLRAKMTNKSQDQWDMISAPWLKALEGLN